MKNISVDANKEIFVKPNKFNLAHKFLNAQSLIFIGIKLIIAMKNARSNSRYDYYYEYLQKCYFDSMSPEKLIIKEIEQLYQNFIHVSKDNQDLTKKLFRIRIIYEKFNYESQKFQKLMNLSSDEQKINIIYSENVRRYFESALIAYLCEDYALEINLVLDKIIKNYIFDSSLPNEYKKVINLFRNNLKEYQRPSFGRFKDNLSFQNEYNSMNISQKYTFIFELINKLKENLLKEINEVVLKNINSHRARGTKIKDPTQSSNLGTNAFVPINKFESFAKNETWVAGQNQYEEPSENQASYFNYIQINKETGRYFVAGASGTTVNFLIFLSLNIKNEKNKKLNNREQAIFLLGLLSYLVLGGHHSLDEVAQSLYYDFGQKDHYEGIFKESMENNQNNLHTLIQNRFQHFHNTNLIYKIFNKYISESIAKQINKTFEEILQIV
jgi:hypothetical protein